MNSNNPKIKWITTAVFLAGIIMICIGIYAVLVQTVAFTDNIIGSICGVMGYTVLLCFALFKTGSLAKSVMSAH